MNAQLTEEFDEVDVASQLEQVCELPSGWQMKKLKPLHKQVASLVAQGQKNKDVARILNITPEYVSMLLGQPLVQAYIAEMNVVVGARLEAMFEQSVTVIGEAMASGNHSERLKGARLQLEATKRIGRPDPNGNPTGDSLGRLEQLSERLVGLLSQQRVKVIKDESQPILDAEFSVRESSGNQELSEQETEASACSSLPEGQSQQDLRVAEGS